MIFTFYVIKIHIVLGNYNSITGTGNTITGNFNRICGNSNRILGNQNTIQGLNNEVMGIQNIVNGQNNCPFSQVHGMNMPTYTQYPHFMNYFQVNHQVINNGIQPFATISPSLIQNGTISSNPLPQIQEQILPQSKPIDRNHYSDDQLIQEKTCIICEVCCPFVILTKIGE